MWIRPPNAGPYITVAALLGLAWYVAVISVASVLTESAGVLHHLGLLVACIGSSILVALRLRGFIAWSDSAPKALASGLLVTLSVTAVIALAIPALYLPQLLFSSWGLDGGVMLFFFLAFQVSGQLVLMRFFVILPLGLFSQYALSRVTHSDPAPLDRTMLAIAAASAVLGAFYFALQ